jgi:hypothetical protein
MLAPAIGHAAAKRTVVVDVSPAGDWRAEALVQSLTADLADDRLAPRAPPPCAPCDDGALRAAGVELVVRATLGAAGPGTLGYELRALWAGAPGPVRGAIALRTLDRAGFAGVLRDRLHRLARTTGDEPPAPEARSASAGGGELPAPGELAIALAAVIAFLATPIALAAARDHRLAARAAAWRTLLGVACLGAVALAVGALAPVNARGVLFASGGVAWGAFAAVTIPVVFPPLIGLGRVGSSELWRVIAGWSGLAVQRAILVALVYAPVAVAIAVVPELLGWGDASEERLALVLPLALLVMRQWVRVAIAVAAERLDRDLVRHLVRHVGGQPTDPAADAAAWQDAVRGYFVGYLRRNGLPIDDDVLDRLRVLPATGDEVCVYGGGATHPRIAIPRPMLELALAPAGRPHDYAAPRVSTLHWTQWNAGLVMATEPGAAIATREQRQPRQTTTDADPSESAREVLGEPPTLIGIVEPSALDRRPSYHPHDDPAWLDWDSGEDHDGTDPGDRDFLFGVLVHAVARIQRHGDRLSTVALALRRASRITAPLGRLLERGSDAIGDDHAAIRGARHHLVQYLGWEVLQREDLLTARAYAPELEAMSLRVLAERGRSTGRAGPIATRARDRLGRLSGLVHGAPPVRARWRRLALAGAVAAGAGVAALAVADAVRYHGAYTERHQPVDREKPDHGKN